MVGQLEQPKISLNTPFLHLKLLVSGENKLVATDLERINSLSYLEPKQRPRGN